jgi:DMSO/TMAO reductase YedYZ molybdopterin-dependent catalytic subunit
MKGRFLRFTSTLLLALIGVLTITGLYGLMWPQPTWMYEVHRGAGWAVIALAPFKAVISWRSLKRGPDRRFDRSLMLAVSLVLAVLTLSVLAFGVMWAWRAGPEVLGLGVYFDAVISWHWMIALGLLPLLALHAWRRWPRPKRVDFAGRRQALKMLGLAAAGAGGWVLAEAVARSRQSAAAPRRFTGSREEGSFSGLGFPVTHTVGQGQVVIDPASWTLRIGGAVARPLSLTYDEILARTAREVTATLDCTSGWYTTQAWSGVLLGDLLDEAGLGAGASVVVLKDASGYPALLTAAEARKTLLATHSGGQVFDHWHGFPLRAVVPSRRGWQWVKWLTEIEVIA